MRRSSAVLLTRRSGDRHQVFLVERAAHLRFFGGYWAFPGGVVDEVDRLPGDADERAALERCALRELFEETGARDRCAPRCWIAAPTRAPGASSCTPPTRTAGRCGT